MQITRVLAGAVVAPALLAALAGCSSRGTLSVSGTAGPAGVGSSSAPSATSAAPSSPAGPAQTASPSTSPSGSRPGSSGPGSSGSGCPATSAKIPSSAGSAITDDLDGDGKTDRIWLADDGSRRVLGVRTASGAVFSTTYSSASPISATAIGGAVSGGRIILLDTGRSAALYAVVNCSIVKTLNAQGKQYTFDEGFTGFGTGAGCVTISSALRLVGYQIIDKQYDVYHTVKRTTIELSGGGRRAANGTTVTLGTKIVANSGIYQEASQVGCGANPIASEPKS